jgi:hypothetical protein
LLRGGVLQRHTPEHLLEEDALVRRMLVDEHEAFGTFRHEIKIGDAADDAQAEAVGDERLGARRGGAVLVFGQGKDGLEGLRFGLFF